MKRSGVGAGWLAGSVLGTMVALGGATYADQARAAGQDGAEPPPPESTARDSTTPTASTSSPAAPYRVLQVVSASLFAVSYLPGVVVAAAYRNDNSNEHRQLAVLAYPVAGPFLAKGTIESGEILFIPTGVMQGLSAVGFIVGTAGAASASSSDSVRATGPKVRVTPLASPGGAGLQVSGLF